jgi:hypothetical protein
MKMKPLRFAVGLPMVARDRAAIRRTRMELLRKLMLAASVVWLAAGAVFDVQGFGVPAFVSWRPMLFLGFLAINASACAVVVSEYLVAARPDWTGRRTVLVQSIAGGVLFISVMAYLEFVQSHAVTASVH